MRQACWNPARLGPPGGKTAPHLRRPLPGHRSPPQHLETLIRHPSQLGRDEWEYRASPVAESIVLGIFYGHVDGPRMRLRSSIR